MRAVRTRPVAALLLLITAGVSSCILETGFSHTASERRQEYVDRRPSLDHAVREAILSGDVIEGMSELDVVASWGRPRSRASAVVLDPNADSEQEEWLVCEQLVYLHHLVYLHDSRVLFCRDR